MFKVVCVDPKNWGPILTKGEIYTVEIETTCPVCGRGTYKLAGGLLNRNTYCSGYGKSLNSHHNFGLPMFAADCFRIVDNSFGEKIASEIEFDIFKEDERTFKFGCE